MNSLHHRRKGKWHAEVSMIMSQLHKIPDRSVKKSTLNLTPAWVDEIARMMILSPFWKREGKHTSPIDDFWNRCFSASRFKRIHIVWTAGKVAIGALTKRVVAVLPTAVLTCKSTYFKVLDFNLFLCVWLCVYALIGWVSIRPEAVLPNVLE
jgi:hypothetical protein